MSSVSLKTPAGKDAGSIELDAEVFGIQPNVPVMHQVVTAQLAARRAGTQSTKTRAEVSGGGKKPFKQKGTGNARQGSTRAPHFSGGGVALGPKPRKYDQKTPKKMIKLALRSALSDRAAEGKVVVIDAWGFEAPKTKAAISALSALGVEGKALVVVDINDTNTIRSFLNLPSVQLIEVNELNAYDILCNDYVVFTQATLPGTSVAAAAPAPKKAAAKKAATPKAQALVDAAASEIASAAADLPKGAVGPSADGSAPEGYEIKGNADSGLYHVPGSSFYNRTVAEFWFATAEDAEAAGFQLPPSQRESAETEESN
jgi:large subunit ribosomal protein L4